MKVFSLEQAECWFLRNSSGSLTCVRDDGEEEDCRSYPQAKKFFSREEE